MMSSYKKVLTELRLYIQKDKLITNYNYSLAPEFSNFPFSNEN